MSAFFLACKRRRSKVDSVKAISVSTAEGACYESKVRHVMYLLVTHAGSLPRAAPWPVFVLLADYLR